MFCNNAKCVYAHVLWTIKQSKDGMLFTLVVAFLGIILAKWP